MWFKTWFVQLYLILCNISRSLCKHQRMSQRPTMPINVFKIIVIPCSSFLLIWFYCLPLNLIYNVWIKHHFINLIKNHIWKNEMIFVNIWRLHSVQVLLKNKVINFKQEYVMNANTYHMYLRDTMKTVVRVWKLFRSKTFKVFNKNKPMFNDNKTQSLILTSI